MTTPTTTPHTETTGLATHTGAAGRVSRARERIPSRRGLSGRRWYQADSVDQLLDTVEAHLAAVISDRARIQADCNRLADIDHARRHGLLPTTTPIEAVEPDDVRRLIRTQDNIDRLLGDANQQAAAIINDARQQYLNPDHHPADTTDTDWQARAEHAQTQAATVAAFLATWTENLSHAVQREQHASAARAQELRDAHIAAQAMLDALPTTVGQVR